MGSSVLGDRPFHHALLGRSRASAGSAYSPVDTSSGAECDHNCRHLWSIHHELRTSLRSQDLNFDSQSALLHSQVPAVTSPIFPDVLEITPMSTIRGRWDGGRARGLIHTLNGCHASPLGLLLAPLHSGVHWEKPLYPGSPLAGGSHAHHRLIQEQP